MAEARRVDRLRGIGRGRVLDPPLLGWCRQGFIMINLRRVEFRGTALKKPLVPVAEFWIFFFLRMGQQDED
jgi:hypothetical protein